MQESRVRRAILRSTSSPRAVKRSRVVTSCTINSMAASEFSYTSAAACFPGHKTIMLILSIGHGTHARFHAAKKCQMFNRYRKSPHATRFPVKGYKIGSSSAYPIGERQEKSCSLRTDTPPCTHARIGGRFERSSGAFLSASGKTVRCPIKSTPIMLIKCTRNA